MSDELSIRELLYGEGPAGEPPPVEARLRQTEDCPSVLEFYAGVRGGWSEKHRVHVEGDETTPACERCSRLVAAEYMLECPSVAHAAMSLALNRGVAAFERHVERDQCNRCRMLLRVPRLKELGALMARPGELAERVRAYLKGAPAVVLPLRALHSSAAASCAAPGKGEAAAQGRFEIHAQDSGIDSVKISVSAPEWLTTLEVVGPDGPVGPPRELSRFSLPSGRKVASLVEELHREQAGLSPGDPELLFIAFPEMPAEFAL